VKIKPEEYVGYFEDLIRSPNVEMGPKHIFEIASSIDAGIETLRIEEGRRGTPNQMWPGNIMAENAAWKSSGWNASVPV